MSRSAHIVDTLVDNYADTLKWITEAVAGIPAERFAEQFPVAPNHPAWTLSHLACTAASLREFLLDHSSAEVQAEFALYGPGTKPVNDLAAYAPKEELIQRLTTRHAAADACAREWLALRFGDRPPKPLRALAPTVGHLAVYLLTSHEHYHLAQITQWRRAAGIV